MIDKQLADDAEFMADRLGYDDLSHYIMDLIREDLSEKEEIAAISRQVLENMEDSPFGDLDE